MLIDNNPYQMGHRIDHTLETLEIILVDQDTESLNKLASFFRSQSAITTPLVSAQEALHQLNAGLRADIVIADYRLGGISGIDLLWAVRRHWPDMLTILIIPELRLELTAEASLLGIHAVIHKSHDDGTFQKTLQRLVSKHIKGDPSP